MKIGGIPNKGKRSFSTYLFMKWKRVELAWRRWSDPEFRKKMAEAREKDIKQRELANPFHPKNRKNR